MRRRDDLERFRARYLRALERSLRPPRASRTATGALVALAAALALAGLIVLALSSVGP